jgi:hypothetical protein
MRLVAPEAAQDAGSEALDIGLSKGCRDHRQVSYDEDSIAAGLIGNIGNIRNPYKGLRAFGEGTPVISSALRPSSPD